MYTGNNYPMNNDPMNNDRASGIPANGSPMNGNLMNGNLMNGNLMNGNLMNGNLMNGNLMNGVPVNPAPASPAPAEGCLAWDAEISDDGAEFLILPEGDYLGQVIDVERGWHEASEKLPACNMVTIHMTFQTEAGAARAQTNLYMVQKLEWKLSSFFRCIGFKRKGEPMQIDWTKVPGTWGRVHLKPGSFDGNGGKTVSVNEIVRFLDYDAALMRQAFLALQIPQMPPAAPTMQPSQVPSAPSASPAPHAPRMLPAQPRFTDVTGDVEPPW